MKTLKIKRVKRNLVDNYATPFELSKFISTRATEIDNGSGLYLRDENILNDLNFEPTLIAEYEIKNNLIPCGVYEIERKLPSGKVYTLDPMKMILPK